MSSITVAQFAIELKMPSNVLLEQLREAGVNLTSVDASVTESDKAKLLESLRRSHGATEGTKITLTRRKTSEIRQADGAGRSRTIQVEVRKKRTFVKRDAAEIGEAPVAEGAEVATPVSALAASAMPVTADTVAAPTEQLESQSSAEVQAPEAQAPEVQAPEVQAPEAPVPDAVSAPAEGQDITPSQPQAADTPVPATPEVQAQPEPAAEIVPVVDAEATPPVAVAVPVEPVTTPDAEPTASVAAAPEAASLVVDALAQTPDAPADSANTGVQAPADTASPKVFKPMRGRAVTPAHVAVEGAVRDEARRASEAEAAALREMLNRPRKVVKPPEPDAAAAAAAALSGTLHKPASAPAKAAKKEGTDAAGKKVLKSGQIASTWSDDASRKKPAEKRDAPAAPGRDGWRAGGKSKSG
ncbi:MAG: translation initiation factor IF-2 associated domain-containing protein, partial [Burkholderiaceae bacterium]|nr:translation initiation factor IF-2 associated domain-containing protein [Burkholderiaceae bacterium]